MLRVIVSEPQPFGGIKFLYKDKQKIKRAIKSGHTPVVVQYLHGELESAVGYDIGVILNGEECAIAKEGKYIEGIYFVKVAGYDKLCKGYFYNTEIGPRAVIVDFSNEEDVEYALDKYNNRKRHF